MLNLLMVVVLSGCIATAHSVITDYDHDANFDNYQTYYWSDDFQYENGSEEPLFYNSLIKKRLKEAIELEMDGRGYQINERDPDLLISARVIVQQENKTSGNYYPYFYGYYPYNYQSYTQKKEGGVIIEFIDKERKQLIWQGYAPEILYTETKDKKQEIRDAVSMIFSKYNHRVAEDLDS